jgi:hypothetical protein
MSIFESESTTVNTRDTALLSFKDCPNRCIDGYYVDPYKHEKIKCKYCQEMREKMVKDSLKDAESNQTLKQYLRIPESIRSYGFDAEKFFTPIALKELDEGNVAEIKKELSSLISNISLGNVPDYSVCIYLKDYAEPLQFIYAFLVRSYLAGLKTLPVMNTHYLRKLRLLDTLEGLEEKDGNYSKKDIEGKLEYTDLLEADILVVSVDDGMEGTEFQSVKGIVQLRGSQSKPTVVVTRKDLFKTAKYTYAYDENNDTYIPTYSSPKRVAIKTKDDALREKLEEQAKREDEKNNKNEPSKPTNTYYKSNKSTEPTNIVKRTNEVNMQDIQKMF